MCVPERACDLNGWNKITDKVNDNLKHLAVWIGDGVLMGFLSEECGADPDRKCIKISFSVLH